MSGETEKSCLPVHHQLPEFTQTHVHWVGDAIQPSHLLSPAGSQGEKSHPWQRSWGRRPDSTQMQGQASGVPLDILEHLPPKLESAYLTALCFHLHFWHYGGLSPTTSLWKGANLELQLINLLVVTRVFQSKNSSDGSLACLTGLSRPHVIVYSLPTVRGMRCFKLPKYRFFWEVRKIISIV